MPIASVEFQSWETCDPGLPAIGEAKFTAAVTATPVTCDKATVDRQWNIDYYSFKAFLDTKDAFLCQGVTIWNNDDCSGSPVSFLPFHGSPVEQGLCLADSLDPTYVSFKLACEGFGGPAGGAGGP